MSDDLDDFWIHTITVEDFLGQDEDGVDQFAAPTTRTGFLEQTNRIVRTATGSEVVSSAQFYGPATDPLPPLDSRVTVPGQDSPTLVLSAQRLDSGPLGLPDHHFIALA